MSALYGIAAPTVVRSRDGEIAAVVKKSLERSRLDGGRFSDYHGLGTLRRGADWAPWSS